MDQITEDKYKDIPLDEHVLHMWAPFPLRFLRAMTI